MTYRVQARIGVAAPASAVWSVISDLESWGAWNPLYPEVEGRLSIGSLLLLRRVLATKGERMEVRVVDWVPNAQIVWARSIAPFARSLAYLEIEALTERGCILAVGEIFSGVIGDMVAKKEKVALNFGLQALCEAAKARAEETWDGTPDEPVPPPPPAPKPAARAKTIQMSIRGRQMIDDLYSAKVLGLVANMPRVGRLARPDASSEKHSKLCGSRILVDVALDEAGRVADFAQTVQACALGQAAAAILGAQVIGADRAELVAARDQLRAMLKEGGPAPTGRFSDLVVLQPVKDYPARHASTMLAFEAAADAVTKAWNSTGTRTSRAGAA